MKTLKLKKIVAVTVAAIGISALAEPKVEITRVDVGNARDGVVTCTYNVSGVTGTCDIDVKITAGGGTKTKTDTISAVNGTGNYTVDTKNDAAFGAVYTDVAVFMSIAGAGSDDNSGLGGVQLWKDGPYWATCNVGASKPEDSGYYFWWGDTVGYTYVTNKFDGTMQWEAVSSTGTIQFESKSAPAGKTYKLTDDQLKAGGYLDSKGNLTSSHDAATAYLGAPWRMPTKADLDALENNCTTVWTNNWEGTGVNGLLVKGNTTGYTDKSIFLPAAGYGRGPSLDCSGSDGYFWSSTPDSNPILAWYLTFDSGSFGGNNCTRYLGQSVRPVRGFAK